VFLEKPQNRVSAYFTKMGIRQKARRAGTPIPCFGKEALGASSVKKNNMPDLRFI
jgi:hypothetical protein